MRHLALSLVIPAYNEGRRLPSTLTLYLKYLQATYGEWEVIIVDDGSTDTTSSIVHEWSHRYPQLRLVSLSTNRGKGYAVRRGVEVALGERILFADADGSTPLPELAKLEQALDAAEVAVGSRVLREEGTTLEARPLRRFLGYCFRMLVRRLCVPVVHDTQCGFKLFRGESARFLFSQLSTDRFAFDVELLRVAYLSGMSIQEVPITWQHVNGSRINLVTDSLEMMVEMVRIRLRHPSHAAPQLKAAWEAWRQGKMSLSGMGLENAVPSKGTVDPSLR